MKVGKLILIAGLSETFAFGENVLKSYHTRNIGLSLSILVLSQTTYALDISHFTQREQSSSNIIARDYGDDDDNNGFTIPFFGGGYPGSGSGSSAGAQFGSGGFADGFGDIQELIHYRNTHGIIMAVVMVLLFPIGGLIMRIIGIWWLHAAWQVLSALVMIAGFGIGIYLARETGLLFNNVHTILGTVVIILFLTAQPVLGFLQHAYFTKNQKRGPSGYMHAWLGRITIVLGIVTGGLGLKLARTYGIQDESPTRIYIIISAIMVAIYLLVWVTTAVFKRLRSRKMEKVATKETKMAETSRSTSSDEEAPVPGRGRI